MEIPVTLQAMQESELSKELNKALFQLYEGAITYGEWLAKTVSLVPPPCELPDLIYSPLMDAINTCMDAEQAGFETTGLRQGEV